MGNTCNIPCILIYMAGRIEDDEVNRDGGKREREEKEKKEKKGEITDKCDGSDSVHACQSKC